MRLSRHGLILAAAGVFVGTVALAAPSYARGGGFAGGSRGFRSPGAGNYRPGFLTPRSRVNARLAFERRFFGKTYSAGIPFGFGHGGLGHAGVGFGGLGYGGLGYGSLGYGGLGYGGLGYGGSGYYGPGVPEYDIPPTALPGPVYGQGTAPDQSGRTPIEPATLVVMPGAKRPQIPTVITPFEVRPGTMAGHDDANTGALPTVIAGR